MERAFYIYCIRSSALFVRVLFVVTVVLCYYLTFTLPSLNSTALRSAILGLCVVDGCSVMPLFYSTHYAPHAHERVCYCAHTPRTARAAWPAAWRRRHDKRIRWRKRRTHCTTHCIFWAPLAVLHPRFCTVACAPLLRSTAHAACRSTRACELPRGCLPTCTCVTAGYEFTEHYIRCSSPFVVVLLLRFLP